MKSIRILTSARHDLVRGYRFYESQATGVGRYFLDTPYSEIDSLALNAGMGPKIFESYHRLLSRNFPWSIYYKVRNDQVLSYAVLDNRTDPSRTRQRLRVQET